MQTIDLAPSAVASARCPEHAPLALQTRGQLVESVHYGSVVAVAPETEQSRTIFSAGDPAAEFYPRSALKPLQAVAMVRAGLVLPTELLALAAASHSGAAIHQDGAARILKLHSLTEAHLGNGPDLPYGVEERKEWLRAGGGETKLAQNCSGKHAAMLATCVINGWPLAGYLEPDHPLQKLVVETLGELTGDEQGTPTVDGCGTPLFSQTLSGMARAFGRLAAAAANAAGMIDVEMNEVALGNVTPEAAVASAMGSHPVMVAGEGRDVTELMRLVPGLIAKDGFEGVQLVGLPNGSALALKISDGGDRARMPVTVHALGALGIDTAYLKSLAVQPVLGGGRVIGSLQATNFISIVEAPQGQP